MPRSDLLEYLQRYRATRRLMLAAWVAGEELPEGDPLPALRPDEDLRARVQQVERQVLRLREQARQMMR
jgi:hypothetical protein